MPKRRKKPVVLLAALAMLVVLLAPIYYVQDASGAYLIWGHDQAYIFIPVLHPGLPNELSPPRRRIRYGIVSLWSLGARR